MECSFILTVNNKHEELLLQCLNPLETLLSGNTLGHHSLHHPLCCELSDGGRLCIPNLGSDQLVALDGADVFGFPASSRVSLILLSQSELQSDSSGSCHSHSLDHIAIDLHSH